MEDSDRLARQVANYETKLRRSAGARVVAGGDPALGDLLGTIAERRSRRARDSRPAGARTPVAPSGGAAGQVLAVDPYGARVRVFRIGRPDGFDFRAGQYMRVGASVGRRRKFSIASAPHEPYLELAVELREGGQVTPALFALRVGDSVELGDVGGSLRLDGSAGHHLMVATGTGIAPLRSMLRDALHRDVSSNFTVLLGASHAEELPFHDELVALAAGSARVAYTATVSRPEALANRSWGGSTGRVDALARSVAAGLDPRVTRAYAVGNAGMVATVRRDLERLGFGVSAESYG